MHSYRFSILPVILALTFAASECRTETFLEVDFNSHATSTYTAAMMKADWKPPAYATWNNGLTEGRAKIISAPGALEGKSLDVHYPKGSVGAKTGGVQFTARIPWHEDVSAEYHVKFQEGFDFVKGGKLPGLCGGGCPTGGEKPTGTNGWSARFMFRAGGKAVLYLYHMDQPTEYGEDLNMLKTFVPGKWYKLKQRIKMNTPGKKDGIAQVWLDDQLVMNVSDLRFRSNNTMGVDAFFFSTFFGGSGSDWAAKKDEHAFFDKFKIFNDPTSSQVRAQLPGRNDAGSAIEDAQKQKKGVTAFLWGKIGAWTLDGRFKH